MINLHSMKLSVVVAADITVQLQKNFDVHLLCGKFRYRLNSGLPLLMAFAGRMYNYSLVNITHFAAPIADILQGFRRFILCH